MKNRLFSYFFVGLAFGVLFWFYFSAIGRLANRFGISHENPLPLEIWAVLTVEFLLIFGVWLIPTLLPMRYEFRRSRKVNLSVMAVIITWVSAVFGYYLTYLMLLAFIGLPNMEHYLVLGHRGSTFWHDWAELFPRLILSRFLQWTVVSIVIGGFAGLVTSSLYSLWINRTRTISPV